MESLGDGEFVSLGVQEMGRLEKAVREFGSSGDREFVSFRVKEIGSSWVLEFMRLGVRELGRSGDRKFVSL